MGKSTLKIKVKYFFTPYLNMCEIVSIFTGKAMWKVAGIRRRIALSKSWGRFVAPMMMTVQSGSVPKPSQSAMNCAFIIAVASWSWVFRTRKKESRKIKWPAKKELKIRFLLC